MQGQILLLKKEILNLKNNSQEAELQHLKLTFEKFIKTLIENPKDTPALINILLSLINIDPT